MTGLTCYYAKNVCFFKNKIKKATFTARRLSILGTFMDIRRLL